MCHDSMSHHVLGLAEDLNEQLVGLSLIPNSVADTHRQAPDNIMQPHHQINLTDVF